MILFTSITYSMKWQRTGLLAVGIWPMQQLSKHYNDDSALFSLFFCIHTNVIIIKPVSQLISRSIMSAHMHLVTQPVTNANLQISIGQGISQQKKKKKRNLHI